VTRSSPLLLSVANVHVKLGELDHAAAFCAVLRESGEGLSTEQKMVLVRKEREITAGQATAKGVPKPASRRMSAWQAQLDEQQVEKLDQQMRASL